MLISNMDIGSEAYAEPAASAQAPIAELNEVCKSFGTVQAVSDMNLSIAQGEFLSFFGPSGGVKTTALRMLAGFETPTSGNVLIGGSDVSSLEPYKRPVNMVFQSYALFPHLTVGRNIGYGLKQRRPKIDQKKINEKVAHGYRGSKY